jgi:hypothetical protein
VITVIRGEQALAEFRQGLTGRRGLDLLAQSNGRVLVQLPVGIGKSWWLDEITIAALGVYALVLIFCPTRRLIEERRPLIEPPRHLKIVKLRRRPSKRCGPARDHAWKAYETRNLGALGRAEICDSCPLRRGCFWPDQYGEGLEGARLIYATQTHLDRAPGFIETLRDRAGAATSLALIDESNAIATPARSVITSDDLLRFHETLEATTLDDEQLGRYHQKWTAAVAMLQEASTADLQDHNWRFPRVRADWAVQVQRTGVRHFGDDFRFPGFALNHFARSAIETRRRGEHGEIEFANRIITGDCIIFSGTTNTAFAQHRLGGELATPFSDYRFVHPETRFWNLASSIGTRRFFSRNAAQVLDFFAALVAQRVAVGKRVLLIGKKRFIPACAAGLNQRFVELGAELRVQTEGWTTESLQDRAVVPLIGYGMIGTNIFEDFDAAYCLSGYYVNEPIVNQCVQDLVRRDLEVPITIETVGIPKRRRARVVDPEHRFYDVAKLVQPALEFREANVVVQAIGRVRPFSRPREIITFQMGELPGVTYDAEFTTLGAARRHFGIPGRQERRKAARKAAIADLRAKGHTQAETARTLGISERTVRTYENPPTGNFP